MGRVAVDGALQWPSYEGAWTMRAGTGCIVKATVTKVARSVEQALGVWEGGKNRDGEGGVGHNMSQVEIFGIVHRTVWRTCFQRIRFSGFYGCYGTGRTRNSGEKNGEKERGEDNGNVLN